MLSALLVLAIGLLVEQDALTRDERGLERAALLLSIYGLVISWLRLWLAVRIWRDRTVRTIQSWRSSYMRKK